MSNETNVYAVALMTEGLDNGTFDLKHSTFNAVSRQEAIGLAMEYYETRGEVIHRVNAIRVYTNSDNADLPYIEELKNGNKIAAIKKYREDTGLGLKESKDYIDSLVHKYGITFGSY